MNTKEITIRKCKEIITNRMGFKDWDSVVSHHSVKGMETTMGEVAELYANLKLKEKEEEIENLLSVMVAAAEEIQEHWQAHCDQDGYGPANLMHRLEKGIAANYPGYKPGAFAELQKEIDRLKER